MLKYSKNKMFFNQSGFCVISSFLNQVELKSLNKKIKSFIQKKVNILKGENINFTKNKNVNTMHNVNNYLRAIKNNNGITFWIALDESNKTNGGLYYLKSSHKLGLLRHENSYVPGTSQKIKSNLLL